MDKLQAAVEKTLKDTSQMASVSSVGRGNETGVS